MTLSYRPTEVGLLLRKITDIMLKGGARSQEKTTGGKRARTTEETIGWERAIQNK